MLRVPSSQNKENPSRRGGCGCNRVKFCQNAEFISPKVLPNRLKLDRHNALSDITLQKNNICRCVPRERSKSTNEGRIQSDKIVASGISSNKRNLATTITEATTSYDPNSYVQKGVIKRPTERHKIISYNHIIKREIREILEDKQTTSISSDLNRFSKNQVKPKISIDSSHHTYTKHELFNSTPYTQHEQFSSTKLPIPKINEVRRHSCSSVIESEKEHFANSQHYINKTVYKTACGAPARNIIINENAKLEQYQKNGYCPQGLRTKNVDHRPVVTSGTAVGCKFKPFISPILPNSFTNHNTLISKRPEKLREPKIKKRIYKSYYQSSAVFVGDIYNKEYLNDIFRNIKKQEREITLNENFLLRYNSNSNCRAGVLNWILKEQAHLNFSESEYYLAVNLLDHVLASVAVPINMYQLTIISTLWIAMKLIGSNIFKASTLIGLCESAYVTEQLLKMEQKVLKIMNFKIHTIEPSVCVNYYLKFFDLQENSLAKLSVYYILDSFSLAPQFSSSRISLLAAACVKYTLIKYHKEEKENINYNFTRILSQEEVDKVNNIETQIFLQLMNMIDENYVFKEPYYKYNKLKGIMPTKTTKVVNL